MTFDSLNVSAEFMRSGNPDLGKDTKWDDAMLMELNRSSAIEELRQDLFNSLGLKADEYGLNQLDLIATSYTSTLQKALAYKQLQTYYLGLIKGENSIAERKYRIYERSYDQVKAGFARLVTATNVPATITKIRRG